MMKKCGLGVRLALIAAVIAGVFVVTGQPVERVGAAAGVGAFGVHADRHRHDWSTPGVGLGAPMQRLQAATSMDVQVTGRLGIPANAIAVVANVTAVDASGPGYLQVLADRAGDDRFVVDVERRLRRADHSQRVVRATRRWRQAHDLRDLHHRCRHRHLRLLHAGDASSAAAARAAHAATHPRHPDRARMDATRRHRPHAAAAGTAKQPRRISVNCTTSRLTSKPKPGSTCTTRTTATSPASTATATASPASARRRTRALQQPCRARQSPPPTVITLQVAGRGGVPTSGRRPQSS